MAARCYTLVLITIVMAGCSQPAPAPNPVPVPPPVAQPAPPVVQPAPPPAPETSELPFVLADLGWGDALTPIARFTGQEWVNTWPEEDEASVAVPPLAEIPDAWLGQPVPRAWQLWQRGKARTVTVIGARRGERDKTAGCTSPAVLDIDKPAGSPPDLYEKTGWGFAVNTSQRLDMFRVVDQQSDEWRALGPGFMREVLDEEQLKWAVEDHDSLNRYLNARKQKLIDVPLELEVSQPQNADGAVSPVYYFEMSRKVQAPDGVAGFKVAGWIRKRSAGTGWWTENVMVSSISEEGEFTLSPLIRIRHSGRDFWVMFVGGIESSAFGIYEVTADHVLRLLTAGGGGC